MDSQIAPHPPRGARRVPPRVPRRARRWPLRLGALLLALALAGWSAAQPGQLRSIGVDASVADIPLDEILSGGPPPNGIPALGFGGDHRGAARATPEPSFVPADAASAWLGELEPVIVMTVAGETRLYPLQILTWHEIANDEVNGVPVAVTFCPLCNSALSFDRRVPLTEAARDALLETNPGAEISEINPELAALHAEQHGFLGGDAPTFQTEVDFGVSGMLYNSNLLMFDTASSTLWSQLLGAGNVGSLTGTRLVRYPAQIVGFAEAREAFPEATVLSRDTGIARDYGRNPYTGYDDVSTPPFFPVAGDDERLEPKARVATLEVDGDAAAFPFAALRDARALSGEVGGVPVVALWQPGANSALGASRIAAADDVGAVGVFDRRLDGRTLEFVVDGDAVTDTATGSAWNVLGVAKSGPLAGERLEPLVHDNTLWFAWAAFKPDTRIIAER